MRQHSRHCQQERKHKEHAPTIKLVKLSSSERTLVKEAVVPRLAAYTEPKSKVEELKSKVEESQLGTYAFDYLLENDKLTLENWQVLRLYIQNTKNQSQELCSDALIFMGRQYEFFKSDNLSDGIQLLSDVIQGMTKYDNFAFTALSTLYYILHVVEYNSDEILEIDNFVFESVKTLMASKISDTRKIRKQLRRILKSSHRKNLNPVPKQV
jgi:hypothetical protein